MRVATMTHALKLPAPMEGAITKPEPRAAMRLVRHSLSLDDFEVTASIGIHDFEKAGPQRLIVSVRLMLDPAMVARDDDIATVVDYDFLREGIRDLLARRHYHLQETLVEDILALCGSKAGVIGARVASRKPDVYPDCAGVGYAAEVEFIR